MLRGGFIKLLNDDWGVKSTCFAFKKSFLMALVGLVLYCMDVGTDLYAGYTYTFGEEVDEASYQLVMFHNCHFGHAATISLDDFEQYLQDPAYISLIARSSRGHFCMHTPDRCHLHFQPQKHCSQLEIVYDKTGQRFHHVHGLIDNDRRDLEGILFYHGAKAHLNFDADHVPFVVRYSRLNGHEHDFIWKNETPYLVAMETSFPKYMPKKCAIFKVTSKCFWTRKILGIQTFATMFLPGLFALCKLLMEERETRTTVNWAKKVLLLTCFPFIGVFCKIARLIYHESKEFEVIDYSITAAEVLAESTLQFLVQHVIFLTEMRPSQMLRRSAYIPFFSICASGASIIMFYIKNIFRSGESCSCSTCPRITKQWFVNFPKACAGLVYFLLIYTIACFYRCFHRHDRAIFGGLPFTTSYFLICLLSMLGFGILRTLIVILSKKDNTFAGRHGIVLPLVLGMDTTEFLMATSNWSLFTVSLEWVMVPGIIIVLNAYTLIYHKHLHIPVLPWINKLKEDLVKCKYLDD